MHRSLAWGTVAASAFIATSASADPPRGTSPSAAPHEAPDENGGSWWANPTEPTAVQYGGGLATELVRRPRRLAGLDEAEPRQAIAHYYQYSNAHGLRRLALPPVRIANSTCFSPNGRQIYFSDSPLQTIWVCDYDAASAQVGAPRVFVQWQGPQRDPDGSVIDAEGCLWNAEWGTGTVVRYAPEGGELARYQANACNTTCPALGGPNGDELMVSSARVGLSAEQLAAQPLSGSLFGTRIPAGLALADALFADA